MPFIYTNYVKKYVNMCVERNTVWRKHITLDIILSYAGQWNFVNLSDMANITNFGSKSKDYGCTKRTVTGQERINNF